MKVFSVTTGADTGGWGGRMKAAFDAHSDWQYRAMVNADNYIEYPFDLPYRQPILEQLYDEADVVHLHNTLHGHDFYDGEQGKPTVLTHHGTLFRGSPATVSAEARAVGCVQTCSTIDLEQPDVPWLGIPYPLDGPISTLANRPIPYSFADLRERYYQPSERIRIAHAPTERRIKSTDRVLAAMRSLVERGYPVELILIEGQPWRKCLARKAQADIFIDQVILGYGCNAIEAWAMGIPVVAGTTDPVVRDRMLDRWSRLPFAEASEDTLEQVLTQLVESVAMRVEYSAIGAEHVRRWHDAAVVVPLFQELYRSAQPTVPAIGSKRRSRPMVLPILGEAVA